MTSGKRAAKDLYCKLTDVLSKKGEKKSLNCWFCKQLQRTGDLGKL